LGAASTEQRDRPQREVHRRHAADPERRGQQGQARQRGKGGGTLQCAAAAAESGELAGAQRQGCADVLEPAGGAFRPALVQA